MLMDLDRISVWKSRISSAGAIFLCLFLISLIDGGIGYLRQPFNSYRLLPGDSVMLTGPMAPEVRAVDGMNFEAESPAVSVFLDEVISGFWLGTRMWRGRVVLSPDIPPGSYLVSVFGREDQKKVGANTFQLIVYENREARIAASNSYILRHSGVSPWVFAGLFLSLGLVACGCLYVISGKKDRLLATQGEAEVFLVRGDETGVSIYFALGRLNGIEEGSELLLMDSQRCPIDQIRVESVSDTNAVARVAHHMEAKPGCLVKKIGTGAPG